MDIHVHLRMPLETINRLDRRAIELRAQAGKSVSRASLITKLVEKALDEEESAAR